LVSIGSEYGPGLDAEEWFAKTVEAYGGRVIEELKVPVANPDFAPFLPRAADTKPDALFVFVPTGAGGNLMKQFIERGLDKAGMKLVAISDLTDDDLLNKMGDAALGAITDGPYSASHDLQENKAFVAQFKVVNPSMRTRAGLQESDFIAILHHRAAAAALRPSISFLFFFERAP
jgi:branched-chain amino acid transport system substrate-binding protein